MFPHAQEKLVKASGDDSGGSTGEARSSSQIASIRHVLRRVNMFLFLSLYFCMDVYVCMCMYMLSTCFSCTCIDTSLLLSIDSQKVLY